MRTNLRLCCTLFLCACAAASADAPDNRKTYTGTYSTTVVESTVSTSLTGGGTFPCTNTYTMSGTVSMTLDESTGALAGSASITGSQVETAVGGGSSCLSKGTLSTSWSPTVTGTPANVQFSGQNVATNGAYAVTSRTSFAGALANGVVTGTLGFSVAGAGTIGTTAIAQSYNTSTAVTLR